MADIKRQIKKGLLEIAVLSLLENENLYGYGIIQSLKEKSNGVFDLKEGTLYPILYRLEDNKFISSYWETDKESRQKPRKYYKLTPKGKQEYIDILEDYKTITEGLSSVIDRN